jgi:transcriptional regulator with XRE-family HTH domain
MVFAGREHTRDSTDRMNRDVEREIGAQAAALGACARGERERRKLTVRQVAAAAGLSLATVGGIESGRPASLESYVRLADALHLKVQFELANPRRRSSSERTEDPVHSAMGEIEAAHLRRLGFQVRLDEPFQHYQFAGRGDVVAWSVERAALLHIENKTEFPNLQAAFGAFNSKQAYLGDELASRLGVKRWRSETHVLAMLWSSEILRTIRQHRASFEAIDSDGPAVFDAWWVGAPTTARWSATAVLLDPRVGRRGDARLWASIADPAASRPRYRNYTDALDALRGSGQA